MRRLSLLVLAGVLAVPVAVGCDNASKTNPDLKVPDVPSGNRSQPKAK